MLMPFATVSRSSNITGHDMGVLGQHLCFNVVGVSSRRTVITRVIELKNRPGGICKALELLSDE
jgi:hypothetical protein